MSRLDFRQKKIQEKKMNTPWRQFVMEIASWYPLNFYKNNGLISKYHEKNGRVLYTLDSLAYEQKRNDSYNAYTVDVVENKSFRYAFQYIFRHVYHESLKVFQNSENSSFTDIAFAAKNAYLCSCVLESENVFYSAQVKGNSVNVMNSLLVYNDCQNIYSSKAVVQSSFIFYSAYIQNSSNIWFSSNLIGCMECIDCDSLENVSYCIGNKQHERDDYFTKKSELLSKKNKFGEKYENIMEKRGMNTGIDITGHSNLICEHIEYGFMNYAIKQGRNVCFSGDKVVMENVYDAFSTGCSTCSDLYGVMGVGYNASHIYCCMETAVNVHNCYYSYYIESCSYCLGCIGLKNKSYCIFNKQYEKEERFEKVDEIFAQMEREGTLGEFFPGRMNPFYFNDTAAYLIDDSFTKEEVIADGYLRREEEIRVDIPEGVEVVTINELDQYEGRMIDGEFRSLQALQGVVPESGERTIHPDILKKVIEDEKGNYYRIIPMEYKFLKKYGLPLPRKHRLERLKMNFRIQS